MVDVYVGLGANLGDRAAHLLEAIRRLASGLEVVCVSSPYRTAPVGIREQPDFLNAVVAARTEAPPREVLGLLLTIEAAMGRRRGSEKGGPRSIDLDLLAYDGLVAEEPGLTLPHPRLAARGFVLVPLAEVAPELRPAAGGPTVAELLAALREPGQVERVALPGWPRAHGRAEG